MGSVPPTSKVSAEKVVTHPNAAGGSCATGVPYVLLLISNEAKAEGSMTFLFVHPVAGL